LGYVIPLAYCVVVYGITWLSGLGSFSTAAILPTIAKYTTHVPQAGLVAIYLVNMAVFGLIAGLLSGTGEELGWRGMLLPELMKVTSFNKATLITGAIWTLWHLPLILFADYITPGIPRWYGVIMFTIMVTGMNFVFSWLRAKSGSFWPAAVLHASHNLFIQTIFTPLTAQNSITPYIIDEFGIGMALIGLVLLAIFIEKRRPTAALSAA
jgi:membrane protease YdiL (CAAX protease family)